MTLEDLCRRFIAIESTPARGNAEAARFIAELSREWGFTAEIEEALLDGVPQANVIIYPGKERRDSEICFVSRLGTRDPGNYSDWTRTGANPFGMSTDGEWAYGLGMAEAKADFLCKLLALKEFARDNGGTYRRTPVLVGTYGMEDASGAIKLARKMRGKTCFAVVSAPTRLHPADRGPGFAKVEIMVPFTPSEMEYRRQHDLAEGSVSQTKMFHASPRQKWSDGFSDNPILKALEYLAKLPGGISLMSLEGGSSATTHPDVAIVEVDLVDRNLDSIATKLVRVSESIKKLNSQIRTMHDDRFDPPYSTIGVGLARTYADHVVLSGYCRLLPFDGGSGADRQIYEKWLESLRIDCAAAGAGFRLLDYKPPFLANRNQTIFDEFKSVSSDFGMGRDWGAAPICTEANVFSRLEIPSIVIGPGEIAMDASIANERVSWRELTAAKDMYRGMMERMCL